MEFTLAKACLIADALNGIRFPEGITCREHLRLNIASALSMDRLDTKWGVDGTALVHELSDLDEEDAFDTLQQVEKFWEASPHENIEEGLKAVGLVCEEDTYPIDEIPYIHLTFDYICWLQAIDGVPQEDMHYRGVASQCNLSKEGRLLAEKAFADQYSIDEDGIVRVKMTRKAMEDAIQALLKDVRVWRQIRKDEVLSEISKDVKIADLKSEISKIKHLKAENKSLRRELKAATAAARRLA